MSDDKWRKQVLNSFRTYETPHLQNLADSGQGNLFSPHATELLITTEDKISRPFIRHTLSAHHSAGSPPKVARSNLLQAPSAKHTPFHSLTEEQIHSPSEDVFNALKKTHQDVFTTPRLLLPEQQERHATLPRLTTRTEVQTLFAQTKSLMIHPPQIWPASKLWVIAEPVRRSLATAQLVPTC